MRKWAGDWQKPIAQLKVLIHCPTIWVWVCVMFPILKIGKKKSWAWANKTSPQGHQWLETKWTMYTAQTPKAIVVAHSDQQRNCIANYHAIFFVFLGIKLPCHLFSENISTPSSAVWCMWLKETLGGSGTCTRSNTPTTAFANDQGAVHEPDSW